MCMPVRLKRFSVTSVIEKNNNNEESFIQTQKNLDQVTKSIQAPSNGSILHNVFERLKYQQDFDYEFYLRSKLSQNVESFIEGVDYITALQDPPMLEFIRNGKVEWGFQVQVPAGVLEGQIDLWAEYHGDIWVVDYKSGSLRHSEKAFQQLKYYAWALRKAYKYEKFKLAVVYPLSKEIKVKDCTSFNDISFD